MCKFTLYQPLCPCNLGSQCRMLHTGTARDNQGIERHLLLGATTQSVTCPERKIVEGPKSKPDRKCPATMFASSRGWEGDPVVYYIKHPLCEGCWNCGEDFEPEAQPEAQPKWKPWPPASPITLRNGVFLISWECTRKFWAKLLMRDVVRVWHTAVWMNNNTHIDEAIGGTGKAAWKHWNALM